MTAKRRATLEKRVLRRMTKPEYRHLLRGQPPGAAHIVEVETPVKHIRAEFKRLARQVRKLKRETPITEGYGMACNDVLDAIEEATR